MGKNTRDDVKSYYELGWEKDRLKTGKGHAQAIEGEVENARTLLLLERYLPKQNSVILDVGGAAGAYAFHLANLGHSVHLLDLTPLHIEQALAEQKKQKCKLASCGVGDACSLDFADNFANVVLCMGPLYHLPERVERMKCLKEAFRVLKPGGLLFAAGISRFVSLLDFLRTGSFDKPHIQSLILHDLETGCHQNPTKDPKLFTTAYFHKPDELRQEIADSGFLNVDIMAIEGPILVTKDLERHWANEGSKNALLLFAEQVEREPAIMGMSNHLAAVGYKAV